MDAFECPINGFYGLILKLSEKKGNMCSMESEKVVFVMFRKKW